MSEKNGKNRDRDQDEEEVGAGEGVARVAPVIEVAEAPSRVVVVAPAIIVALFN